MLKLLKANATVRYYRYLFRDFAVENLTSAVMVRTSVLNDALKAINNAEKAGKRQVMIRPSSKVIVKFLRVMQRHGIGLLFLCPLRHKSG